MDWTFGSVVALAGALVVVAVSAVVVLVAVWLLTWLLGL